MDGGDLETFAAAVEEVGYWADAVNATDNTAAHAHASNVAVAIALLQCGFEPVLQVVCRDKNRLACQADIVGAALHGVQNICCLTGDDVSAGDEPQARRVFDLDRAGALEFVDGSVPGISVPAETVDRIRTADDQGEAAYELAREQARFALSLPGVRGIHIADFRRDGSLGRLCADLGLSPQPERESHANRSAVSV